MSDKLLDDLFDWLSSDDVGDSPLPFTETVNIVCRAKERIERDAIELIQLRALAKEQHEAFSALLKYLDDHDWGLIPEGETADKARAALQKYEAMQK